MLGISDDPHFRPGSNLVLLQRKISSVKDELHFYIKCSIYKTSGIFYNFCKE